MALSIPLAYTAILSFVSNEPDRYRRFSFYYRRPAGEGDPVSVGKGLLEGLIDTGALMGSNRLLCLFSFLALR